MATKSSTMRVTEFVVVLALIVLAGVCIDTILSGFVNRYHSACDSERVRVYFNSVNKSINDTEMRLRRENPTLNDLVLWSQGYEEKQY